MKYRGIACLIVVLAVAGCASVQPVAPSPTAHVAQTPRLDTATPSAEATRTSTSAASSQPSATALASRASPSAPTGAVASPTPPDCSATPTGQASAAARPLRYVFLKDGKIWIWQEETNQARAIPAEGQPVGIYVSTDGRLVAYRERRGGQESLIRVVDVDGGDDRILATVNASEVPQRYPGSPQYYMPTFGWVPGTHLVYYSYQRTCCGEGYEPLEITRFIDGDTGVLRFTLAGGEVEKVSYAPGGRQMAALTASELRLIDMSDGSVVRSFPVQSYRFPVLSMSYSPDGRWLAVATKPGFTIIDVQNGDRRDIPFEYQPYGMGSWSLNPPIFWQADGRAFYTVFSVDSQERLFSEQMRNTVWRIGAEDGTVASIYEFTGGVWLAQLSPDRTKLLYRRASGQGDLTLHLADLSTGREKLYDTGKGINLSAWGWAPDSLRFAYLHDSAGNVRLGNVCGAPVSMLSASQGLTFLDADRYLTVEQMGELQRHKVTSLDGKQTTIVDLAGLPHDKEPPYDRYGPLYGYFLGD